MVQKIIDVMGENKKMVVPILLILLVITVIYVIYKRRQWDNENPILLKDKYNLRKHNYEKKIIKAGKLPNICSLRFTLCFWMKIHDYNYKYDKYKSVLYIGNQNAHKTAPGVWLYPKTNNLAVRMACKTDNKSNGSMHLNKQYMSDNNSHVVHDEVSNHICDVSNIPLQAWTMVGIVLNNRQMDVYINGKLVRSCLLPGIPDIKKTYNMVVSDDGGFDGELTKIQLYSDSKNSDEIYDWYLDGPTTNDLTSLIPNFDLTCNFE